jgi:hypothetical protein
VHTSPLRLGRLGAERAKFSLSGRTASALRVTCVPPVMATSLERRDKSDPSTWTMSKTDSSSLESRILAALNAKGHGATSVELETGKLKGGYICDTMRVFIGYGTTSRNESPKSPKGGAREEAEGRQFGTVALSDLPKSVADRPTTAILKMASPESNDHDVALRLRLYEREWHFYENMASRVPVRVPVHLGSVKDEVRAATPAPTPAPAPDPANPNPNPITPP